jgi:hypothetical protein
LPVASSLAFSAAMAIILVDSFRCASWRHDVRKERDGWGMDSTVKDSEVEAYQVEPHIYI